MPTHDPLTQQPEPPAPEPTSSGAPAVATWHDNQLNDHIGFIVTTTIFVSSRPLTHKQRRAAEHRIAHHLADLANHDETPVF